MTVRETSTSPPPVPINTMIPSSSHSLGPWPRARDIRLFSYRDMVFKIRLIMHEIGSDTDSNSALMNNSSVHSDIDRCIATLLKSPPNRATPQHFRSSEDTSFTVEVRSWKPSQSFMERMEVQK